MKTWRPKSFEDALVWCLVKRLGGTVSLKEQEIVDALGTHSARLSCSNFSTTRLVTLIAEGSTVDPRHPTGLVT